MTSSVIFPRYAEDIATRRRTLMHAVEDVYKVGEQLCLIGHPDVVRGLVATVINVERVLISELTADDEVKLNCPKEAYLERWNALHPNAGYWVFAVEFRYGFADESTAGSAVST